MKELTPEEKTELYRQEHPHETNATTKEEYVAICRKCGCTEEEIDELLIDKEKEDTERGFPLPWECEVVPYLGFVERVYYFDEDDNVVDRTRGCEYEDLGLTPPWSSTQPHSTL